MPQVTPAESFPSFPVGPFDYELRGVCGEFGSDFRSGLGAGVQALYLQTALTPEQLDWVTLISEMPGSAQWSVRLLLQRNVDDARVRNEICPYLEAENRIKFFNPLTLTLLPVEYGRIVPTLQTPKLRRDFDSGKRMCQVLQISKVLRFAWRDAEFRAGTVNWKADRANLVAIDGQHRLSALRRFRSSATASAHRFPDWRIPAVIVYFRRTDSHKSVPTVHDIVRRVFIDINTEARTVPEERRILLSDDNVAALCTQELVQRAHENDSSRQRPHQQQLPLLFFDWRGENESGASSTSVRVKSIVEVRNWFQELLHIRPGKAECRRALDITDDRLNVAAALRGDHRRLNYQMSNEVRKYAGRSVVPALSLLLERFDPLCAYTRRVRRLERELADGNDVDRHALERLRWGVSWEHRHYRASVAARVHALITRIDKEKRDVMPAPINMDVGMRGIVSAFASLRRTFGHPNWMDYAQWFTGALNAIYRRGLFFTEGSRNRNRHLLLHIVYAPDESVVNYRLGQVADALGAYTSLFVLAHGSLPDSWLVDVEEVRSGLCDRLRIPLRRGYKKHIRRDLVVEYPDRGAPLDRAVAKAAKQAVEEHIDRIMVVADAISGGTTSVLEQGRARRRA